MVILSELAENALLFEGALKQSPIPNKNIRFELNQQ